MKKINKTKLEKIVKELQSGEFEENVGIYLIKGYRIQISKYQETTAERVSRLYNRRRKNGQCIRCGKKVTKKNKLTKKLYRLCKDHRVIDLKK